MKVLHTRSDLLDLAIRNAPTKACSTVIASRGGTVYRGVNPAIDLKGWIVEVQGQSRKWFIGLYVNEADRRWKVVYHDELPAGSEKLTRELL